MSKFIDTLKRLSQAAPAPMGFMPSRPSPSRLRIQLLAVVAPENLDQAAEFAAGADAVLLPVARQNPSAKRLAQLAGTLKGIPWGGWLKGGHAGVPDLVKAGCDFIIFPASNTPLTIAAESGLGKILEVESSLNEGLLRAINNLPADAVFVTGDLTGDEPLTWQHLLLFQRFASLLTKPLVVPVPYSVGAEELKALWEAGVDCVVVETEGMSSGRLKELRKIVDGLAFPSRSRRDKIDPMLPRFGSEAKPVEAEEEEDEE